MEYKYSKSLNNSQNNYNATFVIVERNSIYELLKNTNPKYKIFLLLAVLLKVQIYCVYFKTCFLQIGANYTYFMLQAKQVDDSGSTEYF